MPNGDKDYFDPKVLAGISNLALRARYVVEGLMSGIHKSRAKGFSVEFDEHREYSPGDEIRRKLKRVQFPAVRFILLSQKRISRSSRLRHWILLALRTLAIVFLALLLANPIFQTGAGLFAGGGPVSLVVLLDNSLSMTWSGDGNGFKQAKEAARLLISALNEGDRAALIPTNVDGKEPLRLKGQKDILLKELEAIEIADGTANLSIALTKAYELLNEPV